MAAGDATLGPFLIIGAGGHGACLAEVLDSVGAEILGFVDPSPVAPSMHMGLPVQAELPRDHLDRGRPIALGVGDNYGRYALHQSLIQQGATDAHFPAVAHRDSSVSSFATLGPGSFVFQGANVGPEARIGRFCVLATGATATHHSVMADYSFVAVRAVLGASSLGERSFVGLGAVVHQGITIGSDVVVGAQSFVRDDIENQAVAHGVPAQVRRTRAVDEPYLGIRVSRLSG
jgi:sugar O-acyltransferase (sialic acid O-acetyltransferase NeuD family)